MNIALTILLFLVVLILLFLIVGAFLRKEHYVRREIVIDAPCQKVFDYVRFLKNQDAFNENAMAGGERKKEFHGTDGTAGYVYAWSGDRNAGVGEKEIISIVDGERVEAEIRFVKPMAATARVIMETEALPDGRTKVYWTNKGTLRYPINLLIPTMERSVAKSMDRSLANLKRILEDS